MTLISGGATLRVGDPPGTAGPTTRERRRGLRDRGPEIAVVAVALVLNVWNLSVNGFGNDYYAAAVRSMADSWHAFFYASVDPGGWITTDKPPLALWVQALSARLFGYSSWSMLLPGAIAGVVAVALVMWMVRRSWGRTAGLVAGLALATMPVAVAVARSNNPDGILVLLIVAAAAALLRAVEAGRLSWLVAAGALVGAAFLTKLLVALIVLPALWLTYLVFAPRSWRIRILHLVAGTAVVAAVSAGWVLAVDRTPVASRPWIGSSTDGSAADLVLGYNGIGRLTGADQGPGGGTFPGGGFGGAFGGGIDQFGGEPGVTRFFNAGMGDQVMWLAPLAAAAAVAGLYAVARHRRRESRATAVVLFSGWAATTFVVFSFARGIFHNYYVSLLAPAIAALVGIGVSQLRQAGRRGRVVAAVALAVTAGLQLVLLRRVEAYTWLRPTVTIALLAVTAGLGWSAWRIDRVSRRTITGLVGAGVALVLVAPTVWSSAGDRYAPIGTFPDARPATGSTLGGVSGQGGFAAFGGTGIGLDEAMIAWLRNQQEDERWIVAVGSVQQASAAIIGGDSVMPMGGFTGSDPAMTPDRLTTLVRDGDLRFVLTGGFGLGGGEALTAVANACTEVPPTTWGADGEQPASGIGGGGTLYDCQDKADAIDQASETAPSDADTPTPGGGYPGGVDTDELERCLSEQGVTLPDSSDGMPDLSDPDLTAALQECGLPSAAGE